MKTTNQNTKSGLKNRTEQSSSGNRPQIDFTKRSANRALDMEELLALLSEEAPHFFDLAEIVGDWVWIQFENKQPSEVTAALAEFGFHWNNTRQTWQHPCGTPRRDRRPVDPRQKYGSHFAAEKHS